MRKKYYKLGSAILVLSMMSSSIAMPEYLWQRPSIVHAATEESSVQQIIGNRMEVKVDETSIEELKLYSKGVYEAKLELDAGEHKLQVLKNSITYKEEKHFTLEQKTVVYVRVADGKVVDSIHNKEMFHTAALVGNFEGISFVNEEGKPYTIGNWAVDDANGELDYLGGGIFAKTFRFEKLKSDITLKDGGYKVALDDKWDVSYGNGSNNMDVTIPAGRETFTVFVDTLNGVLYDSVRSGEHKVTQNDDKFVSYPSFDYTVSLIGTVRCGKDDWDNKVTGYEFRQLSDSLYIYEATLKAGIYDYKTVFNYDKWYEASGGGNNSFIVTKEEQQVIFLYDAAEQTLYDSVTNGESIANRLGMQAEKETSKIQDNPNGTTTFITTQAKEGDKVELVYAPKEDVAKKTVVSMTQGKNSEGNFDGTFRLDNIFLGDKQLDYVFYYQINGVKCLDEYATKVLIEDKEYSEYQRAKFQGRFVTVPGTFPGKSWDAASNKMEYLNNGLYRFTFKDVPAGNYQYKIATGTWDENYGLDGIPSGSNYTLVVPRKQDVTVYYNDITSHRAVTSVSYRFVDVTITGTGMDIKLDDSGLTGIYKASVKMDAGKYSDLVLQYDNKTYPVGEIDLKEAKEVTFYFDPSTGIYYNDAMKVSVNKDAVKFDSKDEAYKSQFGAVEEGQNVTFSIDTGLDATSAMLIVKGKELINVEMKAIEKDGKKKWSADIAFDEYGQYEYFFAVYYGSYVQIYCDDDDYYGTGHLTSLSDLNPYDLMVYKKGYHTPDWIKNGVIYQIFPDRFFNGNKENDKNQLSSRGETDYEFVKDWYALPENPEQEKSNPAEYPSNAFKGDSNWSNEIYGGDLKGIVDRIDYLKSLGVNVIYLNPVFSSISSHRYDATDYTKIDPILGDMGDFDELVKIAEKNDMHIILDGVFNHVSDDSIYFDRYYKFVGQDGKLGAYPYWAFVYDYMKENSVTQEQAETKAKEHFKQLGVTDFSYTEWFQVQNAYMQDENGKNVTDGIGQRAGKPVYTYEGWWGYDSMPVIKSTNGSEYQTGNWADNVIDGSNSVTQYWIKKGSSGWRLDVANEVSDETWQHFRKSVKGLNSDAVIIGEIWDDATEYILGDMYDSVMNYVFRNAVLEYARGGNAKDSVRKLERIRERYPKEAFYAMMNLVGSHDTARLLSYLDGVDDDRNQKDIAHAFPSYEQTSMEAKQRQYLVAMIQMTYAGAPTIYYGDEAGMTGADDPDNRRTMIWGEGNKELVEWYATLANIRSKYQALRTGSVRPVELEDTALMAYERSEKEETLAVITNNASTDKTLSYILPENLRTEGVVYDLISGKEYKVSDGAVLITVPAYRGVILVKEKKVLDMNLDGLKPAYEQVYKVTQEDALVEPKCIPSASPVASETPVSTKPSISPSPSKKPVLKTQKIHVSKTYYTKELGSQAFNFDAKAKGKLSYKSSDTEVVTVTSEGMVRVKGVGKAYITITANETKTYKKVTQTVAIKVIPKKMQFSLQKKQNALIVSWNKEDDVTGYHIEYATKSNFADKKVITVRDNNTIRKTLARPKKNQTYYVRMRSFKSYNDVIYHGEYSSVKKSRI